MSWFTRKDKNPIPTIEISIIVAKISGFFCLFFGNFLTKKQIYFLQKKETIKNTKNEKKLQNNCTI